MAAVLANVTLDDKYTLNSGRIYLSGIQALVRLPLMQRQRDVAAGLNTAGFISGYRGSPLGGFDEALWKARPHLAVHHIHFQPGVNEELAATAVWGTQQIALLGPARYDGVFGLWYGKGPGVDRCGDVFKHGNHAGTSPHGGVLLVAGDDHGAYSSTLPHQSDHLFAASMIPLLYPCNVQEFLDLGLHGWAMSRYSGCFVGFKALADTVESSASIDADPFALQIKLPTDFVLPEGGLHTRLSGIALGLQARHQEALMQDYKIYAALAYARANRLNYTTIDPPQARLGIIASGKSYLDVREALQELGIDERLAHQIGIRLFKVAMPWPLEPEGVREFARGLEEILVVEEKRQVVEYQLKEHLYNWREDVRPRVIGKFDERGEWVAPRGQWLLTSKADFSVAQIARVIAARVARFHQSDSITARLAFIDAKETVLHQAIATPPRPAYYCSGCPHSTSTKVPEGSLALAGIGCHIMATSIYPDQNKTSTHMGGEGATWIGQAPFSTLSHIFANLGDGTYFHSGYLAIRAALAAKVNITYKILYNDAVAMTGGQTVDGQLSVPMIASQMAAEGVTRIAVVSEDPSRYRERDGLPSQVTVHHRDELDEVQRALREHPGVSVLIYDQVCAAEKRRRRKRGEFPLPAQRLFIYDAVCEGCGDCATQSNCTSVLPLETPLGRKRVIDQSSCNSDYSCLKGFCPSFVTLVGATPRTPAAASAAAAADWVVPEPPQGPLTEPYNILITGIGGTGVITIGALIGMAAHLEGKGVSVLDMTGMSQKNGAVTSHVRIAAVPADIRAARIATAEADLIFGCDLLTTGAADAIARMRAGRTRAIVNSQQTPPGQAVRDPDWQFPAAAITALIDESLGQPADYLDATRLATALLGDAIAANPFLLGYAYQRGLIPLSAAALLRAIELNGVAVAQNQQSFAWGRRAAVDLSRVERLIMPATAPAETLADRLTRHTGYLAQYQDYRYARRYREFITKVERAEAVLGSRRELTRTVADNLFKLMAYKDEYEVARLYGSAEFAAKLAANFSGDYRLQFNLAPTFMRSLSGGAKHTYGAWLLPVFKGLASLRFLRGTLLDPFGYQQERQLERRLITDYRAEIERVLSHLSADNYAVALAIAAVPARIRGFGHIKQAAADIAYQTWRGLAMKLTAPTANA